MGPVIRQATPHDAAAWVELLRTSLGPDYPERQVYEPTWAAGQLAPPEGQETWVAEGAGGLQGAVSILPPALASKNPIVNLGRDLLRPEAYVNGAALALFQKLTTLASDRGQMLVARVLASDLQRQSLLEELGFTCVGFQPFKHLLRRREGILFYLGVGRPDLIPRALVSESLSQVSELATTVLSNLKLAPPSAVRDGVTGYPLHTELSLREVLLAEYEAARAHAQISHPPVEVSGGANLGWGFLRLTNSAPVHALVAQRGTGIVAGMAYVVDELDRCVRVVEAFATDDLSPGALLHRLSKLTQEKYNGVYLEADILMTAPRLLKSAEQVGLVPVAYLPSVSSRSTAHVDVVKLVKLNMAYGLENARLTTHAKTIADIVDRNFQDQKVGVAVINLLRGLRVFDGLGDGELRKISRLFTQKLFRPGDRIFVKGDSGTEAYVVMRGQVDILLDERAKPIATFGNGQIFGELTFLDASPRAAMAVASQPSIVLVVQRVAFNELVEREPHLGMVVMRNIAIELSNRLRRTNVAVASAPK